MVQKWVFRPAGATRCPDKCEIWHGKADRRSTPRCQISRLSVKFGTEKQTAGPLPGAKFHVYQGETVGIHPKIVKISNFGHKFVPQWRLVCNIFTKFLASVRVHR